MSELRKANTDHPYFLTFTIVGWNDLFTRYRYCDILIQNLQYCQHHKGLLLYAYVIMSSHIHLVARHEESKLNQVVRDFKSFTAKELLRSIEFEPGESRKEWLLHMFRYFAKFQQQNSNYMVWQKTSYPIELSNAELLDQKIEYIHNNPVEAGYTLDPYTWIYSSSSDRCLLTMDEV